jgi:hypothetical protein
MPTVLRGPTAGDRKKLASPTETVEVGSGGQPRFVAQALAWVEYRRTTLELLQRELAACTEEEAGATGPGGEG